MKTILYDLTDWEPLCEKLKTRFQSGDWIWLEGELGAGKTTFVRHLMRAWGWTDEVVSPTYPLLVDYQIQDRWIVHLDGYRLEGSGPDPWDYREWEEAIVFAEWPEKTALPLDRFSYKVSLKIGSDESREFKLEALSS